MKGICLCIGLLTVTAVAGQQKETADLKELIRKRADSTVHYRWTPDLLYKTAPQTFSPVSKELKGQLASRLPNGDLLYRLPTDNMPCIKPGNQLVYNMPVIADKTILLQPDKAGSIPNPGL